jgi:outer membrane lipoprotein-sorting protein/peroxiredoxin
MLDQSAQAYAALKGLSMNFEAVDDENGKAVRNSGTIALSRPGKARVDIKIDKIDLVVLSDGTKIYSQLQPAEYRVSYPKNADAIQTVLNDIPSAASVLLPFLAAGNNPLGVEGVKWQNVKLLPDNGVRLSAPLVPGAPPVEFSLYFDPADKLLRRVEAAVIIDGKKSVNRTTITEVRLNPEFTPETFTYTPPVGAKEVVEAPLFNPELRVGNAPIELQSPDLKGKTHSWKEYAGKVVLLHFWARGSKDVVKELPNVLQNYRNYHDMGLEAIAFAIEEDKAAVEKVTKGLGITYPHLFDGKGAAGEDVKNYGIRAVPFSLLIGKDGKIAAVNPHGQQLEPEIVRALAG